MTITGTMSNTITNTMTNTVTMTMSNTMTMTMTMSQSMSWSGTPSFTPSYSITPSNSIVRYFAPIDLWNTCNNTKRAMACITWSRTVVYVTYDSFNVMWRLKAGGTVFVDDTKDNHYVATFQIQPGSTYSFVVRGVVGDKAHLSPFTPPFYFMTKPAKQNGVHDIWCTDVGKNVNCMWENGKNAYKLIRASLYCPHTSTTRIAKIGVRDGNTMTTLQGIPKNVTTCRVDFRIKYDKFPTQKWTDLLYTGP